jgi:hypothetical protein
MGLYASACERVTTHTMPGPDVSPLRTAQPDPHQQRAPSPPWPPLRPLVAACARVCMTRGVPVRVVQADEEPLYIFDPSFAEAAPRLTELYTVPRVFTEVC